MLCAALPPPRSYTIDNTRCTIHHQFHLNPQTSIINNKNNKNKNNNNHDRRTRIPLYTNPRHSPPDPAPRIRRPLSPLRRRRALSPRAPHLLPRVPLSRFPHGTQIHPPHLLPRNHQPHVARGRQRVHGERIRRLGRHGGIRRRCSGEWRVRRTCGFLMGRDLNRIHRYLRSLLFMTW